jgi:ABC-2 type transport system permease protein
MRQATRAEWTKAVTTASTRWMLIGFVVSTVVIGAIAIAASKSSPVDTGRSPTEISLTGVVVGQAIVAMLAVVTISGEYSTGMIRVSLTAVPRRARLLAAKGTIIVALTVTAATVAVVASLVAGRLMLPGEADAISLTDGSTVRAAAIEIVHVALIGLISLGLATAARDSATAVGAVLGLIYLFPIVTEMVTDPDWQRRLQSLGPLTADLDVLAGWAAACLLAGGAVLRLRDA